MGTECGAAAGRPSPSRPGRRPGGDLRAEGPQHCREKRGKAVATSFSPKVPVSPTQERPLEVNILQNSAPFYPFRSHLHSLARSSLFAFEKTRSSGAGTARAFLENEVSQKGSGNRSSNPHFAHAHFCFHRAVPALSPAGKRQGRLCCTGLRTEFSSAPCLMGSRFRTGLGLLSVLIANCNWAITAVCENLQDARCRGSALGPGGRGIRAKTLGCDLGLERGYTSKYWGFESPGTPMITATTLKGTLSY